MNRLDNARLVSVAARSRITAVALRARVAAVALASLAVAALSIIAAPAGAAAQNLPGAPPVVAGSSYLALGDSVTFGFQEPGVTPKPNYHDAASFVPYPEQLGQELHLTVANAACPGETTASLINPSAQSYGCENTAGKVTSAYRKLFPLHVRYKGSQLAYAVSYLRSHSNVRLVSLMIGANDGFLCQATTPDNCMSGAELTGLFSKVTANVRKILSAIRGTAKYKGQLAIVNYYSINYTSPLLSAESQLLNKYVDAAAKPFHVEIADSYAEFQTATVKFDGSMCEAGLLTYLGSAGHCGVHPSYAGQSLLAQALEKAITL
jgi:lysophospholipase L1-like esterase